MDVKDIRMISGQYRIVDVIKRTQAELFEELEPGDILTFHYKFPLNEAEFGDEYRRVARIEVHCVTKKLKRMIHVTTLFKTLKHFELQEVL